MIEVRHLTKKYGNHTAVDDISFTVEPGKIYGFLGPNGAGKSTTMNIIAGCLAPTDGEVLINGHSVVDEPVEAKSAIGYLPETPPLYLDMTPYEYLKFVAEAKGVRRDKIAGEIEDVMESTGTTEMRNRLIRNLSKGYRQRVGIAQAMIGDPDIIILDEPTEGLDPQQRAEIRQLISDLGRDRTVILSSHVLFEVQEVCDNIIVISHGRLAANDTMSNISRSITTDTTMLITVKATPDEVHDVLSSVMGISSFSIVGEQDGATSVRVSYPADLDLRESISFAFSDIRRAVISMGVEEENLEEIFLKLTGSDSPAENEENADGDDDNDGENEDEDADGDDNDNDDDDDDGGDDGDYKSFLSGE